MMLRPIQYYILYDFIEDTKMGWEALWTRTRLAARAATGTRKARQVGLSDERGAWPTGLF